MTHAFHDYFSDVSAEYALRRPSYPRELAQYLASQVPRRELAWDCGCGSGQLAQLLAEHFEQVVATDASREQIAHSLPRARVDYRVARAEASGLLDDVADLIVAAQAAHWFDLERFYAEARRVARDDAVIALVGYVRCHVDDAVDALLEAYYSDTLAPHWPRQRRHLEDGYRSLAFPFAERVAPALEMRASWDLEDFCGYLGTWSATQRLMRSGGAARFDAFRDALARAWGGAERRRQVRWPLTLRVGRV